MPYFFVTRRISHQRCSIKGVLRIFVNFTVKHLCQSLFLNTRPEACNFIKKDTQVFSCEFCKIFAKRSPGDYCNANLPFTKSARTFICWPECFFFFEKYLMTFRFQFHKGLILIFLGQKKIWFLF